MTTFYTLRADAQHIGHTQELNSNTAHAVGQWCADCATYIKRDDQPAAWQALDGQAKTIGQETGNLQNTARRAGGWCLMALRYYGIAPHRKRSYYNLFYRATVMADETGEGRNERRLGAWFLDFLEYIDYEGDVDPDSYFRFTYQITEALVGKELGMPIYTEDHLEIADSVYVNWDDGTQETLTKVLTINSLVTHRYAAAGTYEVKMMFLTEKGNYVLSHTSSGINADPMINSRAALTSILSWGGLPSRLSKLNFSNNSYLATLRTNKIEKIASSVHNAGSLFRNTGITEIPYDLVNALQNLSSFSEGFSSTKITTIRANAFNLPNCHSFEYAFSGCTSLTSVGDRAFRNTACKYMNGIFYGCLALTSVGNDLFPVQTTEIMAAFAYCSALPSLGAHTFSGLTQVVEAGELCNGCTSLREISEDMIADMPALTNFAAAFKDCSNLSVIPVRFFAAQNNLRNVSNLFQGTGSATGLTINKCLNGKTTILIVSGILQNSGLTGDIYPDVLGDSFPQVTTLGYLFYGCNKVNSFNGNMLQAFPAVTSVWYMFGGLTHTALHLANMTLRSNLVTSMTYLFAGTHAITTSLVTAALQYLPNITDVSGMLENTQLTGNVPDSIFANNPLIKTVDSLIAGSKFSGLGLSLNNLVHLESLNNLASNSAISTLTGNEFNGCGQIKSMASAFQECAKLTDVTPLNIPRSVTNMTRMFYSNNTRITSPSPTLPDGLKLWKRAGNAGYPTAIAGSYCFRFHPTMPDYSEAYAAGWA